MNRGLSFGFGLVGILGFLLLGFSVMTYFSLQSLARSPVPVWQASNPGISLFATGIIDASNGSQDVVGVFSRVQIRIFIAAGSGLVLMILGALGFIFTTQKAERQLSKED